MKFAKIQPYHEEYIEQFYKKNPGLENESYKKQLNKINYDGYLWADFWSNSMSKLGYECIDIIPNIESLQRAWVKENLTKEKYQEIDLLSITLEQMKLFKPDIVFLYQSHDSRLIKLLKENIKSIKLLIYWAGSPVPGNRNLNGIDLVLTCSEDLIEQTKSRGIDTEVISHAFDPRINERVKKTNDIKGLSFSGRIYRGAGYHLEREKILMELSKEIPVRISTPSYYYKNSFKEYTRFGVKKSLSFLYGMLLKIGFDKENIEKLPMLKKVKELRGKIKLPVSNRLKKFYFSPVYGLEMFSFLKNSQLIINIHGDITEHISAMRMFEATGVGTCLITDWKKDIDRYFDPDNEVVTFKNAEECIYKIKYLLNNEKEIKRISQNGMRRTHMYHTFDDRSKDLDRLIRKYL